MATSTYTPLANITLSSSAASVTFSSISQAYRDLVLVFDGLTTGGSYSTLRANGDNTGANYSFVVMLGNGSSGVSQSGTGSFWDYPPISSTNRTNIVAQVMDYSAADKHKTTISRGNDSGNQVVATAGRWANTAAITTLVMATSGTFAAGSTFALYGIAS